MKQKFQIDLDSYYVAIINSASDFNQSEFRIVQSTDSRGTDKFLFIPWNCPLDPSTRKSSLRVLESKQPLSTRSIYS